MSRVACLIDPGLTFLSRDAEAWSTFCGPSGRGRARPAPAQSVRSATGRAGRHDPGGTRPPTGGDPAGPPGPDPVTRLSGRAGRVPAAPSARDREFREWATFFAAGAAKRAAAEAGSARAVSAREADDLVRDADRFLGLVEVSLGLDRHVPFQEHLPSAGPSCVA